MPSNVRFRGFAAKASSKVLETVSAMGENYPPLIEEDAVVSINGKLRINAGFGTVHGRLAARFAWAGVWMNLVMTEGMMLIKMVYCHESR